jgi:hypothetical protein
MTQLWFRIKHNLHLKLIAFVFAFVCAVLIYSEPGRIITSDVLLKVMVINVPKDLTIVNDVSEYVTITLQGPQGRINSINSTKGVCVLDLKEITKPGTYNINYRISKISQVTIIRDPETALVQI